jgi:peptidoglycan hydrolase-like protein with peptidoglycan-binding domain
VVKANGTLRRGAQGTSVRALQLALHAAGYRIDDDGVFGPATEYFVQQFQRQHGLKPSGELNMVTAILLDEPHEALVNAATPLLTPDKRWPHDDTASLLAFYGKPWEHSDLLVSVPLPFAASYGTTPVHAVQFHKRGATALRGVLATIAQLARSDSSVLRHVQHYSGSYNYRPVRGSSRLSCHAFGAAVDFDAENLPLGSSYPAADMPQSVVDAFKAQGFFWGGDYRGRKDPMHFQLAHE